MPHVAWSVACMARLPERGVVGWIARCNTSQLRRWAGLESGVDMAAHVVECRHAEQRVVAFARMEQMVEGRKEIPRRHVCGGDYDRVM